MRRILTGVLGLAVAVAPCAARAQAAGDASGGASRGVGMVEAYQELLKDNLVLREQLLQIGEGSDTARRDNQILRATVADLEARVVELSRMIATLRREAPSSEDVARLTTIEQDLAASELERARLSAEVVRLEKSIDEMTRIEDLPPPTLGAEIDPGSDLFRRIQEENTRMRKRMTELDSRRQALATENERLLDALDDKAAQLGQFDSLKGDQATDRRNLFKLVGHVRRLQKNVEDLRQAVKDREDAVLAEQRKIGELEGALARETAKVRAIRKLTVLMDRIDQERQIQTMPDTEKKIAFRQQGDAHYEAGRYKMAESEYLKALAIDPAYADVHYNLGVLYDTQLADRGRAISHFTAYVELQPNAPDSALVRLWMREAELAISESRASEMARAEAMDRIMEMTSPLAIDETGAGLRDAAMRQAEAEFQQGRAREAVAAYRRALDFDPDFAEIHYNLGVIYDDELQDDRKAVRHYRRYLELRPQAEDADLVKSWLMIAEMAF